MEMEEEFDLVSMAQGLKWLMRQLFTQAAKSEEFPELLKEPKSFVQIVEEKKYKNLRLAEAFLKQLAELNILIFNDGKYEWNSGIQFKVKGKSIVEAEAVAIKRVQEKALPLFGILRRYSENLPLILKGGDPAREPELVIWDSLYNTEFYSYLRREALKRGDFAPNSVIIDFGCRLGWSTIDILETINPKKIYAIDPSPIMIELAYENLLSLDKMDKVQFIQYNFNFENKIPLEEKCDGAFIGLLFNRYTSEEITDMLLALRGVLKGGARVCGLQPIKDSEAIDLSELLLYADKEFKGYPEYDIFKTAFIRSGFVKPIIEQSMFFHTTYVAEKPVERPEKKKK
ncbi:MAG: methyltransferase domain-containing protein [Candidatus Helarchaeota archaeon]